jgi:molybdopterin-containing oxidoreductase family iron-sulfur binding subunit
MVIDTRRCIGCNTCAVACKMNNNIPDGQWWNRILTDGGDNMDAFGGSYGAAKKRYFPVNCQHCENPACTRVCPVQATYKDPDTGIVHQNYDKCIGCRMCIAACPYTGVRSFNWAKPTYATGVATGEADIPAHQQQVVEKCTLCDTRVAKGEEPFCIGACPARARYFGDFNDPDSEVSKLLLNNDWKQLLPEQETNPSVYYLV